MGPWAGGVAPKSTAGRRRVPITGRLRDVLLAHRMATGGRGEAHVFQRDGGGPFAPDTVTERARRAWKVANSATIERARRERREVAPGELLEPITLHECRHTFAWLMIAAGVNAKALSTYLGHANISITFDRFGHLMPGTSTRPRDSSTRQRADSAARLAQFAADAA